MASKDRLSRRQLTKLGQLTLMPLAAPVASPSHTSRSASGYGSGSSRTPLTTLKIAVLTPMPSARMTMTTREKAGARRIPRAA